MTGDGEVIDLAAEREARHAPAEEDEHEPAPRTGTELRRYDILTGYWGVGAPPMRHHYPMTALLGCTGCGKTIRRLTPDEPWEHVQWS